MVLFFSVLLGCYLLDVAYPVVLTSLVDGSGGSRGSERRPAQFEHDTGRRGDAGIAASAAVSLTGEREQDTWISLATTLLTPAEIIRAKQFGTIWSARRVGLAILLIGPLACCSWRFIRWACSRRRSTSHSLPGSWRRSASSRRHSRKTRPAHCHDIHRALDLHRDQPVAGDGLGVVDSLRENAGPVRGRPIPSNGPGEAHHPRLETGPLVVVQSLAGFF